MHPSSAMNEDLTLRLFQSLQRNLYGGLKEFRWFRLEVVVRGVVEHGDRIGLGQGTIIKLNLHVDDVSHAESDHLGHIFVVPYAAAQGDAVRHPGKIHSLKLDANRNRAIESSDHREIGSSGDRLPMTRCPDLLIPGY